MACDESDLPATQSGPGGPIDPVSGDGRIKLAACYEFAVSRDGRWLAALGRNLALIDTGELRCVANYRPLAHPSSCSFSSDGTRLAIKGSSGQIIVVEPHSGQVLTDFDSHGEGEGAAVLFGPEDEHIVDASWAGVISVRDARGGSERQKFTFAGEMITVVSSSARGNRWLFVHQPKLTKGEDRPAPSYLTLWDWPLLVPGRHIFPDAYTIYSAALSPDGESIVLIAYRTQTRRVVLQLLDREGNPLREILLGEGDIGGSGGALRWSHDGRLVGSAQDGKLVIYRVEDLAELVRLPMNYASDIAFSPDDSYVALGSWAEGSVTRTRLADLVQALDPAQQD